MQFVKLFNSILDSTIWQESKETKLIWITMMAMSDRNGEIHASIPGLASRTGVTLAECEAALTCLLSPDAYSRTKTDEGRRIAVIDGGWRLLNHGKYRALLSAEERKEYNRVKQQQHRAALKNVNDRSMTISNVSTVQSQSQSQSTDSEEEPLTESAPPPPLDGTLKPKKEKKPKIELTDLEWMTDLKSKPENQGINIDAEYSRACEWCRKNGRSPSRRFFGNWLKKAAEDKPLAIVAKKPFQSVTHSAPKGGWKSCL